MEVSLNNSIPAGDWRYHFCMQLGDLGKDTDNFKITVQDVFDAVQKQKRVNQLGQMVWLWKLTYTAVLCLLFNMFTSHCHLTDTFMKSVTVSLVKSKSGDQTDMNNYRAIALSNTVCKILEAVFL